MPSPSEPKITAIVGTEEFQDAHGAMVEAMTGLLESKTEDPRYYGHPGPDMKLVLELVDKCCRLAWEAGFNEGVCK